MRIALGVIVLTAAVAVSGCSGKGLRELRPPKDGPDDFLVIPSKPLSEPASYAALPPPTPGGSNITDQNPKADAVAALGGKPSAVAASGSAVPSGDAALVTAASRYGVPQDIRASLAAEDAEFRRKEARTANIKLFPVDRYADAYRKQTLDPFAVSAWWRSRGVATPSAPPEEQ